MQEDLFALELKKSLGVTIESVLNDASIETHVLRDSVKSFANEDLFSQLNDLQDRIDDTMSSPSVKASMGASMNDDLVDLDACLISIAHAIAFILEHTSQSSDEYAQAVVVRELLSSAHQLCSLYEMSGGAQYAN